jgi:hypothetical protein
MPVFGACGLGLDEVTWSEWRNWSLTVGVCRAVALWLWVIAFSIGYDRQLGNLEMGARVHVGDSDSTFRKLDREINGQS